jgi:NAD dependent epimerase/dehydratase family enzyme
VKNTEFTAALGKALNRPAILPIPVAALRLLFGEMSQILVTSQRVLPAAALKARYQFRYPHLAGALQQIFAPDTH